MNEKSQKSSENIHCNESIDEVAGNHYETGLKNYLNYFNKNLNEAKNRNAEREASIFYNNMKNRFVEDLSRYCSEIVSVENANIGLKGNIDAVVTAPNGVFNVKAVPAGGYNIQCYHYRVLIKKIK